jgi:hypothetical protein
MNGIARYRIPGIVVTTKGTVLAYSEARRNSSADWGEIEVHLRRSTDGGKTWEAPKHIAHKGAIEGNPHKKTDGGEREQTVNNPVAIVDRDHGGHRNALLHQLRPLLLHAQHGRWRDLERTGGDHGDV